jgi:hypothetical protein
MKTKKYNNDRVIALKYEKEKEHACTTIKKLHINDQCRNSIVVNRFSDYCSNILIYGDRLRLCISDGGWCN